MAASTLRFGTGVTREVGMDITNMLSRLPAAERNKSKIAVFTDPNIAKLPVMKTVEQALQKEGHKFAVFDKIAVEPTEDSWTEAIKWTRDNDVTHFLAVGGGSTMDTAKAANLLSCYPEADMFDFINAPVGKGTPITKQLKPLIAGELSWIWLQRWRAPGCLGRFGRSLPPRTHASCSRPPACIL